VKIFWTSRNWNNL